MRTKVATTKAVNVRAIFVFADCGKCGESLFNGDGSLLVEVPDNGTLLVCWKCGAFNVLPAPLLRTYRPRDTERMGQKGA